MYTQVKKPNKSHNIFNPNYQNKNHDKQRIALIDNRPEKAKKNSLPVVQRAVDVELVNDSPNKKTLRAIGTPDQFEGGSSAGKVGWIGVSKYRSEYYRFTEQGGDFDIKLASENFQNPFTTPEAGHVLGQQNGGNGRDPNNIFAQCGGTNNGPYKTFENAMNKDLREKASFYDHVWFISYLVGNDAQGIKQGNIKDAAIEEASSISEDDWGTWS
ncbi:hypothetical protein [Vibrio sp. YIC-376]|uniref:hypothetical protein n=1 Tax=Vibrio sp. YIC-376 TaxID=3136162 RepID=UPI00402AD901